MSGRKIMIAAAKSGSGKTTITCSLLYRFKEMGLNVRSYKCGPDYIDPMFHRKIIGIESDNLDLFFTDEAAVKEIFFENSSDISVIEGVMGLYDGLGGISEEASSYHLASVLTAPIILVVDAHGMGRSVLAEIAGFKAMDRHNLIKGIILNRSSELIYTGLKDEIEEQFDVSVLGYIPKLKDIVLDSRHLGLIMPDEINDICARLKKTSELALKGIDVEAILEIAEYEDHSIGLLKEDGLKSINPDGDTALQNEPARLRIAVAYDEAFCFYYEDNLKLLSSENVQLIYFSPIHDEKLPDNIQGIILGGGYPELYADKLSANKSMIDSIKAAIDNGIPSLAECGGFMYLHQEMETDDGVKHKMVGCVKGNCRYTGRLVRFGYVTLSGEGEIFPIRGHEFHYFDSDNNGDSCIAAKPTGNKTWKCNFVNNNSFWGYTHLYYRSNPAIVSWFKKKCLEYKEKHEYGIK